MIEPETILAELDNLQNIYLQCRAVFPTIDASLVGHRRFTTAPYYLRRGYAATVELKYPISLEFIESNRCLGKWINENAIIRLHGVLYHHGLLDRIDHDLQGAGEVDFMRRMRNAFTKTSLNYKPEDADNVRLRTELISYFRLKEADFANGEIPTPIDSVVEPIFEACRTYVKAKFQAQNKALQSDCLQPSASGNR